MGIACLGSLFDGQQGGQQGWQRQGRQGWQALRSVVVPIALLAMGMGLVSMDAAAIEGQRTRLHGLDKITGHVSLADLSIGEAWQLGRLRIQVNYCDRTPPTVVPESVAHLSILEYAPLSLVEDDQVRDSDSLLNGVDPSVGRRLTPEELQETYSMDMATDPISQSFSARLGEGYYTLRFEGYLFASSPAINALDHPLYDVWVLECLVDEK